MNRHHTVKTVKSSHYVDHFVFMFSTKTLTYYTSLLYYNSDAIAVALVIISFMIKEVTFDPPQTNIGMVV